jgi:glycosidase
VYSIEEVVNPGIPEESTSKTIGHVRIITPLSAYRSNGQKLEVYAQIQIDASIDINSLKGQLYINASKDRQFREVNMIFAGKRDEGYMFKCEFSIPDDIGGSFLYTVRFSDDNGVTWKYAENEKRERVYRNLIIGPGWLKKANVYEIYPRIHKCRDKDGDGRIGKGDFSTLVDIKEDLPRIKSLNVDAIYLMPIYPIGEINRKGEFGSPYAIKDYLGIDPNLIQTDSVKDSDELEELGKRQLRDLIDTAHREMGMKVILDFVGNHCAPDNVLLDPGNPGEKGGYHPEWFFMDENEKPEPPYRDWWDTVDLKYGAGINEKDKAKYSNDEDRKAMWNFMISVLKYWVEEFDVDGFRCDFAHWVPLAFWRQAINEVKEIKPSVVFIGEVYERLAEHLEVGFDAVYHFELYNQLKSIYHETRDNDPYLEIPHIPLRIEHENSIYPNGYRLSRYTENHDEIRAAKMFKSAQAAKAPTLMCFTLPGVPLIYAGQECGETTRPPLFKGDRDESEFPQIDFNRDPDLTEWYRKVMKIRREHEALTQGDLEFMSSDNRRIMAYSRVAGNSKVIVAINFDHTHKERQWANLKTASNLGIKGTGYTKYSLHDVLNGETYSYTGEELSKKLLVALEQFESHIFVITEEEGR